MAAKKSNIAIIVATVAGFFILGVMVGWALNSAAQPASVNTPGATASGQLTNALISSDTSIATINASEYEVFQKQIQAYIDQQTAANNITQMSVYFRDLIQGGALGINQDIKFIPASLLKVPNMVALLNLADDNPSILTRQLTYDHVFNTEQPHYPPEQSLQVGHTYTVDDLIYRMIVYSDNEALTLLRANFSSNDFNQVYDDLGLIVPSGEGADNSMSVKSYASFFRILYNASYLSPSHSEKALTILSQVKFTKGLVAGVPAGTVVAHKFGERLITETGETQLHDCGIVYFPKHPYLLCVMSRGTSYDALEKVIADVSRMFWNEITQRINSTPSPTGSK
jgi:beta-lactamase class A